MKICPKCNINKDIGSFSKNKLRKDGLQRICKECSRKEHKKFWIKNGSLKIKERTKDNNIFKDKIRQIKEHKKCQKCGENRYWVLDFHHIDPKQKEFNIGNGLIVGQKRMLKEIEKCVVLCSNCHRDFHYLENKNKITIIEYCSIV